MDNFNSKELLELKFPMKLWRLLNKGKSEALKWNAFGTHIIINYGLIEKELLHCPHPVFKTRSMHSFIRQLNMYGFKKVTTAKKKLMKFAQPNEHLFHHEYFQRARHDLLRQVTRTLPMQQKRQAMSCNHSNTVKNYEDICEAFGDILNVSSESSHSKEGKTKNGKNPQSSCKYSVQTIPLIDGITSADGKVLTAVISANAENKRLVDFTKYLARFEHSDDKKDLPMIAH